jgi:hypothetical protein
MRRTDALALFGGILTAAVLAACGLLPNGEPDWVRARDSLPSCGDVTVRGGGAVPVEVSRCLADGLRNGMGAELIVRHRESDTALPLDAYWRVRPDGTGELIHQLEPGTPGATWERFICSRVEISDPATHALNFGGCAQVEGP